MLHTEVIPFLRNHRGMQLLHAGAPAHQARAITAYLNANNLNVVDFPPPTPITRLQHTLTHLGWIKPPCKENRCYIDHTESNESNNSLRMEQPPSELRSELCDVNETPLSCRCLAVANSAGNISRYYVYMDMDAAAGFDLRILWYLLFFCDIFDPVWSLLKY